METLKLPSLTLRYYSDIDEFPIDRRTRWSKYLLEDSAIDTKPDAIKERLTGLASLIAEGKTEDALVTVQNLYFSINAIEGEYDPSHLAFGVLVHSYEINTSTTINSDLSEDALRATLVTLGNNGLTQKQVTEIVETVKKNSKPSETSISLGLPV